jgi:hypothetical protein
VIGEDEQGDRPKWLLARLGEVKLTLPRKAAK